MNFEEKYKPQWKIWNPVPYVMKNHMLWTFLFRIRFIFGKAMNHFQGVRNTVNSNGIRDDTCEARFEWVKPKEEGSWTNTEKITNKNISTHSYTHAHQYALLRWSVSIVVRLAKSALKKKPEVNMNETHSNNSNRCRYNLNHLKFELRGNSNWLTQ